jgi:hypothetical protein
MALADQMIREDSLTAAGEHAVLNLGLPWFRSLPLACINGITVEIDGKTFSADELEIDLGAKQIRVSDLAKDINLGEWYLQDRYNVKIPMAVSASGRHKVRAKFDMVIANFTREADKPFIMSMLREVEISTKG